MIFALPSSEELPELVEELVMGSVSWNAFV